MENEGKECESVEVNKKEKDSKECKMGSKIPWQCSAMTTSICEYILLFFKTNNDRNSRARDSLFSATHTLLKAIGLYTECYITLVAAAIPSVSGNGDYFSAYVTCPSSYL